MKRIDLNDRKIKVLELENDKLNAELESRKKEDLIQELVKDVPKHARTEYFLEKLRGMTDEEKMRALVEDQKFVANFGKGKVIESGDEFIGESNKQTTEADKAEILGSVRKGNLKIIQGGQK